MTASAFLLSSLLDTINSGLDSALTNAESNLEFPHRGPLYTAIQQNNLLIMSKSSTK